MGDDDMEVTLTEDGGAIKTVALKKFPGKIHGTDPVMFNDGAPLPALALTVPAPVNPNDPPGTYWTMSGSSAVNVAGNPGVPPQPLLGHYTLDKTATTATSVTFRGTTADGLEITRTYSLGSGNEDTYLIHHTTTIVNHGAKAVSLARVFINAGMAPVPSPDASSLAKSYLDFGYYDGQSASFITATQFMPTPAMFFGLRAAQPKLKSDVYVLRPSADLHWISVKDQFFATVLTPKDILGQGFYVRGVDSTVEGTTQTTVSGDLELNLGTLAPGDTKKLELTYYVGPKAYVKLDRLGDHQDLIMQFGWFGGFSKILLVILMAIHTGIAPLFSSWAWGWTIIAFTLILKTLTWPLTAIQVRSAKRMGQLSAPMKALREKYKDNPQKMQTEVLELYKKYKVNPAAGCLPMLITFPVFIAFNYMLRTASEMRFQPFFWIHDLSMPDTIAHLGVFSLNLLPLFMTGSMMLQMKLTPSPSADNTQKMMMQFMPLLFLAGFYNMPSGMILYWTCNNLFTILQQYLTNRRKDPPLELPKVASGLPKAKWR
jgi:YidC/Oxa1 family membrane protein insertase